VDSAHQEKHPENYQPLRVSQWLDILRIYTWKQAENNERNVVRNNNHGFVCRDFIFYFITLQRLFLCVMKRFCTVTFLFFATSVTVGVARLKNEIPGIWNVLKIETTDQNLNFMMRDFDLSKLSVEFTKAGVVMISGKDTKTKYRAEGNKIILSEGMIKIPRAEVKANIKSGNLTVDISADLMKQILLAVKDQYLKSGGEVLIAKMIENAAKTYSIEAIIILKRK
jgi:hypothetical protein